MLEILPQILWFALLASSIYTLIAIGLTLVYGILDFIHFSHGDMAMVGAYLFWLFIIELQLPWWVSFFLVGAIMALFGVIIEKVLFKRVRKSSGLIPLVISIGLGAVMQAVTTMTFGGGVKSYRQTGGTSETFNLLEGNLIITPGQVRLVIIAAILVTGLFLFLKYTKTGKAIRAMADNQNIAAILGINVNKTISIIFAIATAMAAVAGLLIAGENNLNITMGLSLAVKAFAAVILGGVGNLWGAVVGAFIIGFSENILIAFTSIPPSYKDAIVFFILIVALMVRPNGILGAKKEAEVRG